MFLFSLPSHKLERESNLLVIGLSQLTKPLCSRSSDQMFTDVLAELRRKSLQSSGSARRVIKQQTLRQRKRLKVSSRRKSSETSREMEGGRVHRVLHISGLSVSGLEHDRFNFISLRFDLILPSLPAVFPHRHNTLNKIKPFYCNGLINVIDFHLQSLL